MRQLVFAAAICISASISAKAQVLPLVGAPVICTNCSEIETQLLQYAIEIEQIANIIEILDNAITNTTGRNATGYRDMTADLQQISNLAQQANLLEGLTGQFLTNLNAGGNGDVDWHDEMSAEASACANAMTQAGNVFNLQPIQLIADAGTVAALVDEVLGALGRQQSLQTLGSSISTASHLLQKHQATMATAMQGQMACQIAKADRQAMLDKIDANQFDEGKASACMALAAVGGAAAEC